MGLLKKRKTILQNLRNNILNLLLKILILNLLKINFQKLMTLEKKHLK